MHRDATSPARTPDQPSPAMQSVPDEPSPTIEPVFERVLLKLSGEMLVGEGGYGIELETVQQIAQEIARVRELGVQDDCPDTDPTTPGRQVFRRWRRQTGTTSVVLTERIARLLWRTVGALRYPQLLVSSGTPTIRGLLQAKARRITNSQPEPIAFSWRVTWIPPLPRRATLQYRTFRRS